MSEEFPKQEYENHEERILSDAEYVINALWKKVMDVDDLPLSVDPSYEVWSKDIEARKNDYARVLFKTAREKEGEVGFGAAKTLKRLIK